MHRIEGACVSTRKNPVTAVPVPVKECSVESRMPKSLVVMRASITGCASMQLETIDLQIWCTFCHFFLTPWNTVPVNSGARNSLHG